MVACIAFDEAGGLIAGMESGIFALRSTKPAQASTRSCSPRRAESWRGMRFNDGRCDRQGRFWSGTMRWT